MILTPNKLRVAILSSLLAASIALPVISIAAETTSTSTQQAQAYTIAAGSLTDALLQFAAQSNITIQFDPALTDGLSSAGLNGQFSVEQGLFKLTQNTGLAVATKGKGDKIYTLNATNQSTETTISKDILVLETIDVKGQSESGYVDIANLSTKSSLAGFSNQPLLDTPFSVKVLPQELFTNLSIQDISGLDRLDASVDNSAVRSGWYSSAFIRGFWLSNVSNYRYNGLMTVNQQATGLENKERVEILKGLSALQAGFTNPGGLINYVTKRPAMQAVNDLHFTANQYGNAKVHVDLSRRSNDGRFGVRLNAAGQKERTYVDKVDGDRKFISLAADARLGPNTLLQLDIEHEQRDQIGQPELRPDVNGNLPSGVNPRTFLGQTWASYPTTMTLVSGKLEQELNDNWHLSVEANWIDMERAQHPIWIGNIQPNGDIGQVWTNFTPNQGRDAVNAQLKVAGEFVTGPVTHQLTFGYSDHRHEQSWPDGNWQIIGTSNIHNPVVLADPLPTPSPSSVRNRIKEQGIFINDIVSFGDNWKLHLGGRYAQRDDERFDGTGAVTSSYNKDVFSPSVAVVFKPRPGLSTYVTYSEGLQNGGTAPFGTTNEDENLNPIISQQIEVGVKAEFGNMTAEVALFQIDRPAEFINSANTFVQDGSQLHRGIELSVAGRLSPEWTLLSSAMLLDAELKKTGDASTEGKRPNGVAEHRLVMIAEYAPAKLADWVFSTNWSYTGDRELNDANTGESASGYSLLGLGARYDFTLADTSATVRINIDNLLDERYWSNVSWGSMYTGAPRTISASLSLAF